MGESTNAPAGGITSPPSGTRLDHLNPRGVITGVTPSGYVSNGPLFESSKEGFESSFDWYAATFPEVEPDDLIGTLADRLGCAIEEGKPLHGYREGYDLVRPEGVSARILCGGPNGAPHAWGSGADAERFATVVREIFPSAHRVSRFDSRIDISRNGEETGTWSTLFKACTSLAEEFGLKTSLVGDYIGKENGRTLYVGSRKSNVYVRLYEKGRQQIGLTRDPFERDRISTEWVRLEVQVRPQDDARWRAAETTADEGWGFSEWTRELAQRVKGLDVETVTMQHKRETDDERALKWVARQYGGTFERIAQREGWQAVWDLLAIEVARAQKHRDGLPEGPAQPLGDPA